MLSFQQQEQLPDVLVKSSTFDGQTSIFSVPSSEKELQQDRRCEFGCQIQAVKLNV